MRFDDFRFGTNSPDFDNQQFESVGSYSDRTFFRVGPILVLFLLKPVDTVRRTFEFMTASIPKYPTEIKNIPFSYEASEKLSLSETNQLFSQIFSMLINRIMNEPNQVISFWATEATEQYYRLLFKNQSFLYLMRLNGVRAYTEGLNFMLARDLDPDR